MKQNWLLIIPTLLAISFTACDDSDEKASIIGKWEGDKSEIQFTPTGSPVAIYNETNNDFNATLEFKDDETVTLISGSQTTTGTFQVQGDKLITTLNFSNELADLSGTFTIRKLSQSTLELFLEDEREITVPDIGTFNGKIKATFYFTRISN